MDISVNNMSWYPSLHLVFCSLRVFKNDALDVAGSAFRETGFLGGLIKAEVSCFVGIAAMKKSFFSTSLFG